MKNLVLLGDSRKSVSRNDDDDDDDDEIASLCKVASHNFDAEVSTVILSKKGILQRVTQDGDVLWEIDLQDIESMGGGWFDVSFVDPELVCLSKLGAIMTVDPTTGDAELVGVFDQGLEAACWSPDKEILLMVTSIIDDDDDDEEKDENAPVNAHLMTMNASFEVLSEVRIPNYSPGTSEESKLSVAWRPDGSLCAVSSVDAEDSQRHVRFYKRESLEVHAIGRAEDASGNLVKNLQSASISWASTGCSQLLASVQRKGKKTHQIVFFESNGLRHREFLLREAPKTVVKALDWNLASDILAVTLGEESGTEKIQLWHRCNYHWYLKKELRYADRKVMLARFSRENPHELLVILSGFEWREYEVRWDPSTMLSFEDKSLAFVVDGASLNLTAFQKALVPPPMCANSYGMDLPINDIAFCKAPDYHFGSCLVQLSDGNLLLLNYKAGSASSYIQTTVLWGDTQDVVDLSSLRSFLVVGAEEDKMHMVAFQSGSCNEKKDTIIEMTIHNISTEPRADVTGSHPLDGQLKRAVPWSDTVDGCLLQLGDGTLYEYERARETKLLPSEAEPLMEVCPWIGAIKDESPYSDNDSDYTRPRLVFGLSSKSRLYLNDVMLAESASSFFLSLEHEFLCYVTTGSRCQTRFLPLKEIHSFDPLMGLENNYLLEGYEPRNVEQGSRVVAILPQKPQMILQMPRGNLESIHPRALVLRYLMSRIVAGVYGEAFRMMRKHKVDLNLIVDLSPKEFLDTGIASFVQQVNAIDYLNLFISTLQNYDVTQQRFPVPTWFQDKVKKQSADGPQTFDFSTKVNQICRKARSVMLDFEKSGEKPSRYYLLPVLSTFAKEDPPRLDEALSLIKDDALKENSAKLSKNPLFSENAQSSIKYLAFLAEYELLFETALGMYDFEIARAVARNSQMDPKIYLPLLKRFNTLPTFFARYEVDMRLKRFDMALKDLHQSNANEEDLSCFPQYQIVNGNSFEDCMKLINEHKLHKLGLELFRTDTEKSKAVLSALGNSLMEQRKPSTALTVYLSTEPPDMEGAMRAARAARDWRCFFSLLETAESKDEEEFRIEKRRQAAREIADDIIATSLTSESKKQANMEASQLLLDYGDDLFGAVDCLTNAQCWAEAYRIATLHSRKDLMKKSIDSAVAYAHVSLGDFEDRIEEFEKTNTKYYEVLKLRKQNVYLQGPEPGASDADETGSLFSVASTMSNMSLRSTSSTSSSSSIGSNVSSVISIKTANTFSMTGGKNGDRHRSKFNKGKKRKKGRKKKPRRKPGSVEELQGLVGVLKSTCPDSKYGARITETIDFLLLVQNLDLARELFEAYNRMRESIEKSRLERIEKTTTEKQKASEMTRSHGAEHEMQHILLDLPIESVVDALVCAELATSLSDFFDFLPN